MSFEEYLISKNISADKFRMLEPIRFLQWQVEFAQMHPESFTTQKKFSINMVRRMYPLTDSEKNTTI